MTDLKSVQSNRGARARRLGISAGLAILVLAALLYGLRGTRPVHADPGVLYVDGTIGHDTGTCGTVDAPCRTISYTLNNRAGSGDTIRVAQGVYTENLTVDKQIVLEGGYVPSGTLWLTRTGETIVDGSNSRTVWGDWDGFVIRMFGIITDDGVYKLWYEGAGLAQTGIGHATSTNGITWTRYAGNPVLEPGESGSWDEQSVHQPFVYWDGFVYRMWFGGSDYEDKQTGYATSTNGLNWSKYPGNPVLPTSPDPAWDANEVGHAMIMSDSGMLKMWYVGASEEEPGLQRVGHATSMDGITWQKHPYPVLVPGVPGQWDEERVHTPFVMREHGIYKMWYAGEDSSSISHIGYATSTNGITWTKYAGNPVMTTDGEGSWDQGRVWSPRIIRDAEGYKMWFVGTSTIPWWSSDRREWLGYATSSDGIVWTKNAANPVFSPDTPGQWGQPVVEFVGGSDSSILDGFTVQNGEARNGGGIHVDGTEVTIRHCTVISNTAHDAGGGIRIAGGSGVVVESNQILSNTVSYDRGSGVFIGWSEALLDSNRIAHNVCKDYEHGNGAIGIEMGDQSLPVTVTNNVVVSNTDKGIMVGGGVYDLAVINNTIASNRNDGILAWGTITVSLLRNNIIASNGYCGIAAAEGAEFRVIDHNDVWQNGGGGGNYCDYGGAVNPPTPGPGDISADPLFVDSANDDYHLQASSPCIDAGTATGAPTTDIEGALRDAIPDIGAYEWGGYHIFLPLTLRNAGT